MQELAAARHLIFETVRATGVDSGLISCTLLCCAHLCLRGGGGGVNDGFGLVRTDQGLHVVLRRERLFGDWIYICIWMQSFDVLSVVNDGLHPVLRIQVRTKRIQKE